MSACSQYRAFRLQPLPRSPLSSCVQCLLARTFNRCTLWLVLEYDPHRAVAAYGRFTAGSRLGTVRVHCHEEGPNVTKVSVAYSLTASAPAGNVVLGELNPSAYSHMMREWHDAIMHSGMSYTR